LSALAGTVPFVTVKAESSITKPSVPELTVKFIKSSYNVTTIAPYTGANLTEQKDNNTIEVIIKNQPFTPYAIAGPKSNSTMSSYYLSLYYDVQVKGHSEYNRIEEYASSRYQPPPQSNLEYTV
jgi:hypothetical protein